MKLLEELSSILGCFLTRLYFKLSQVNHINQVLLNYS